MKDSVAELFVCINQSLSTGVNVEKYLLGGMRRAGVSEKW